MSSQSTSLSPSPGAPPFAHIPSPNLKGGSKPRQAPPGGVDLLVFDILNILHHCWFLSRANLMSYVTSAQKAEDGNFSWVEFTPHYHSHLVKCSVVLVPHPVHAVKRVMFVYVLELLNGVGNLAFFDLQKGDHKANNAQREKKHLAWKWSKAAKCEQDHEAAKVAKLPMQEQCCSKCGCSFKSCKTAHKHKCPNFKVESVREEATVVPAAHVTFHLGSGRLAH
jgi:hypothetical protein